MDRPVSYTHLDVYKRQGPGDPIAPRRNKILLLGLLRGLAVPGVIFLMIMFLDTRIHTRKDIQGKVSAPFLGVIPEQDKDNDCLLYTSEQV